MHRRGAGGLTTRVDSSGAEGDALPWRLRRAEPPEALSDHTRYSG